MIKGIHWKPIVHVVHNVEILKISLLKCGTQQETTRTFNTVLGVLVGRMRNKS